MAKSKEQYSLRLIEKISIVCFLLSFEIMNSYWGKLPTECGATDSGKYFLPCQDLIVYLLSGTSFFLLLFPLFFLLDRNLKKPNGRLKSDKRMTFSMSFGCAFSIAAFCLVSGLLPPNGPLSLLAIGFTFAFFINFHLIKRMDHQP